MSDDFAEVTQGDGDKRRWARVVGREIPTTTERTKNATEIETKFNVLQMQEEQFSFPLPQDTMIGIKNRVDSLLSFANVASAHLNNAEDPVYKGFV